MKPSLIAAIALLWLGTAVMGAPSPIHVPDSLKSQRPKFESTLKTALKQLRDFAPVPAWKVLVDQGLVREARVFETKEAFKQTIMQVFQMPAGTEIPDSHAATVHDRVLYVVVEDEYRRNNPLSRDYNSYQKLWTHELAHQLHLDILGGREDEMGPVWFYEGFAVLASKQFEGLLPTLTEADIFRVVEAQEHGDYLEYGVVMRHFLKKTTLPEMVERARKPDFADWLKEL